MTESMGEPEGPRDRIEFDPAPAAIPVRDDDADAELARALRPWCYSQHIGGNQRAAQAAAKWLRVRGL